MQGISSNKIRYNVKPSSKAIPLGRMNEQRIVESMALLSAFAR